MDANLDPDLLATAREGAWAAVSAAFSSLGRVCLALDEAFRVRHASSLLDALLGEGAAGTAVGRPIEDLLGQELFGQGGALREALLAGERREGWRASLRTEPSGSRLVSVTVAPLQHDPYGVCDVKALYLVVLRPAEAEMSGTVAGPTAFAGVIARSPSMLRIFRLVEHLQHSTATVLITGESGTGKEVVARAIHAHSSRRDGPFVAVNCAALPGELLETELFGHVRGAFTGAVRDRVGRFERAAGGTLFLDEVGSLPVALQAKLLRVLQEHVFERVGESEGRQTDARIIAATNLDLQRAVVAGTFREDLFYRLRVVPIHIPPLRERREDVDPLARALLARVGARNDRALRLSPDALRAILGYPWPGNVRELENALEFAVAVCRGQTVMPEDLPREVATGSPAQPAPGDAEQHDPAERERVRAALEAHRWSRAETARALGMSRTSLWRKMRDLRLAK